MNSYALFNSSNSFDRVGIGSFYLFGRVFNPCFAGDRYYCDLVPVDQGRQGLMTVEE
jgi:hypothetical protein